MPYAIYLRKSRVDLEAEAHGEGDTLARHRKTLLALAAAQQLNVTHIYEEVVSGDTIAARPQMQQLLADVDEGLWEGVLVMEVERLARGDTIDQGIVAQAFKVTDTKIITPLKSYDPNNEFDEEYFEFGLFMARREYKVINRRLQRGRLASVKEGKWVGNTPPYGYRRVKLAQDKGFWLEPDPETAPVVRNIFHWYVEGRSDGTVIHPMGLQAICTKLNQSGIPSPSRQTWTASTVRDLLRKPGLLRPHPLGLAEAAENLQQSHRHLASLPQPRRLRGIPGLSGTSRTAGDPGMLGRRPSQIRHPPQPSRPQADGAKKPIGRTVLLLRVRSSHGAQTV